jgi:hypothetical protein
VSDRFETDPAQLQQIAQQLAGTATDLRGFQATLSSLEPLARRSGRSPTPAVWSAATPRRWMA